MPEPAVKITVALLCSYEVLAILSRGKVPTLTKLDRRCRVVGPVILGGLAVHFYAHRGISPSP